ncbi:prolipoprotein diacylglyceryl transferase [Flavobacterium sp.]|jgi:prolipoprotein diacylglyceryl transferase|uniref:prolipoprotein diacylglyceryl transferase n=1 Tax=Flavobacterium sp. TaxID=239 RepID=UPI002A8039C2|nr:prolipoprotein diacylglyceryl transferase [Flavobacterium sp.]
MIYALNMIWNPSGGIDLGFFNLRFYSLMFVIAFGLGWYLMKAIYEREGETLEKLDNLFVSTVLATLVGARLGHVFFYDWDYFKDHKLEILLPIRENANESILGIIQGWEFTGFAGLASHGAAIAIIIVMLYYSKKVIQRPILWVLDRIVIPVASGAIFVRLGNFMNSEIVGTETTSSFGIKFIRDWYTPRQAFEATQIGNSNEAYKAIETNPQFAQLLADVVPKHPAQLYEAFGYVFVFAILYYMYWKTDARNKLGLLFGTFLVLLWTVRFFVEYVKGSQGGFENNPIFSALSTGQWLSIPFVIAGIYFIVKSKKAE